MGYYGSIVIQLWSMGCYGYIIYIDIQQILQQISYWLVVSNQDSTQRLKRLEYNHLYLYLLKQESYLRILSKLALPRNYIPSTEGHCDGLINDGWVLEPYRDRRSFGIASKSAAEAAAKETMIQYCQSWFCLTTVGIALVSSFLNGNDCVVPPLSQNFIEKVQLLDKK